MEEPEFIEAVQDGRTVVVIEAVFAPATADALNALSAQARAFVSPAVSVGGPVAGAGEWRLAFFLDEACSAAERAAIDGWLGAHPLLRSVAVEELP